MSPALGLPLAIQGKIKGKAANKSSEEPRRKITPADQSISLRNQSMAVNLQCTVQNRKNEHAYSVLLLGITPVLINSNGGKEPFHLFQREKKIMASIKRVEVKETKA